jgi:hypothetical protein
MKLEQWVLFIDMLGYRDINGEIKDLKKAEDFIKFMKSNIKIFELQDTDTIKEGYKNGAYDLYSFYDIQIVFVSDSLIINYLPKEIEDIPEEVRIRHSANTLFIIIKRLQTFLYNCMKEKSIIVRGGISSKFCLIDGGFAVGEGLIEAYAVESKLAVYPRICLSKEIASNTKLIEAFNQLCVLIYRVDTFLAEEDGILYLDYLKHNLSEPEHTLLHVRVKVAFFMLHKATIETKLQDIQIKLDLAQGDSIRQIESVKDKIVWLKEYHNRTLANYKEYLV